MSSSPTIYIALLRGVNVGGHRSVAMPDLRDLLTGLGIDGAQTIRQSGNLVFRSDARTAAGLERILEAEAEAGLGLHADFLIRSAREWKEVIARNPFRKEAERDPSHLVAMFLKSTVKVKEVSALQAAIAGPEKIHGDGRQVYIVYPAGIGRSRVTNDFLERKLGACGTARNWNTVLKLAAVAEAES